MEHWHYQQKVNADNCRAIHNHSMVVVVGKKEFEP